MINRLKKMQYKELIPIIFISFILFRVVNNIEVIFGWFKYVLSILSYVIWGIAIAYLLNPLMVSIEKRLKVRRTLTIGIVYIIFLSFITFSVIIVLPALIDSITQLVNSIPDYITKTQKFFEGKMQGLQIEHRRNIYYFINQNLNKILSGTSKYLEVFLNFIVQKAVDITYVILKIIFGVVISVYFLMDKERIIKALKRALYAFLKTDHAEKVLEVSNEIHNAFSKYIIGKVIDSVIVGIICFIGLIILKVPYAILISFAVGVTNLIPYVGALIGTIFGVLLIVFVNPIKALWILLFLVLLQQVDSWILSPKIIGGSIGISPLLTIIAIIIGGGFYGIMGMFIAIPLASVIKNFIKRYIHRRLEIKNISIFDEV